MELDLDYVAPSTELTPWTTGGVGKLRYGESDRGATRARWYVDYRGRIRPTLDARVVADYVSDASSGLAVTEAYLEWRPLPASMLRQRWKAGAFYPKLSLENIGPGWTSPYTLSSSAINTWVAEEVRAVGAEWSMQRRIGLAGSPHEVEAFAALLTQNDPAGALIAWKGWSVHDRQSRLGDRLPLPQLPQLQPGGLLQTQDPFTEPFREIDHAFGYYAGGGWSYARRARVAVAHYDNRADPLSVRGGQYAWRTRFDHLGAQLEMPGHVGLIVQWMHGDTAMGPWIGSAYLVDADFESWFALATRTFGRQRLSLRYDAFDVVDNDGTTADDNGERGHAWSVAYRVRRSPTLELAVEWQRITTERPAWAYFGMPIRAAEQLLTLQLGVTLGKPRK